MIQSDEFIGILQAAISPVAMISGVGLLLLSMTNRFGRTTDRTRSLAAELPTATPEEAAVIDAQIRMLFRRAGILRAAILLASGSVLCAGLLIVALFAAFLLGVSARSYVAVLFTLSFMGLIGSMALFMKEMGLALQALRLEVRGQLEMGPED